MIIEKITKDVFKISQEKKPRNVFNLSSNVYLIKSKLALIDLGNKKLINELIEALKRIGVDPDKIKKIIFTHFHFDHTGDPTKFKNARFYASKEEIEDLRKRFLTFYPKILRKIKINIAKSTPWLKVIKTPGHTRGSICLFYKKDKVLFTGDTLFHDGIVGRTDLPTSAPEKIENSLKKLAKINYKILCPGHGRNDKKILFSDLKRI